MVLVLLLACMVISCSGTETNPITPGDPYVKQATADQLARYLWGYYEFRYDPVENEVEVVPMRVATDHWNTLKWLDSGPCTTCVTVTGVSNSGYGTKLFDVRVTHPFPTANLTGFDVRGIAMFDGSYEWVDLGLYSPDRTQGDGELVNADGYTTLYHGATAGSGPGGFQGYYEGKFASDTVPGAQLNGFKRLSSTIPSNSRNMFLAGTQVTETFDIDMPDSDFIFGYAVDASWVPADNIPVTDPETDFPAEANCFEPWRIDIQVNPIGLGLTDAGGSAEVVIDVYDYQGESSHGDCMFHFPALMCFAEPVPQTGSGAGYTRYSMTIENYGEAAGVYKVIAWVVDNEAATAPSWLDLTAYSISTVEITEYESSGWAKTWGGSGWDGGGYKVAAGPNGNAYVVGEFSDVVDFDPGPGVEERTSIGDRDPYLAKYDTNGDLVWVRTFGGTDYDFAMGVAVNQSGDEVYVVGGFSGTVDLDPGPEEDIYVSVGGTDPFICMFDDEGEYWWGLSMGSTESDWWGDVVINDEDYIYVTGTRAGFVQVVRIHHGGAYAWGRTFGNAGGDYGLGVDIDDNNNPIVVGCFDGTVDFDTGSGTENKTSKGGLDCFMSAHDPDGNYLWAVTWGGTGLDRAEDIAIWNDWKFIVGRFHDTVDFNPDIFTDNHTSLGSEDAFMSRYTGDHDYTFTVTWGGSGGMGEWDRAQGVCVSGNFVYVSGQFGASVDFDPGTGTSWLDADGGVDAYLLKLNFNGNYQWVRGWGGLYEDVGYHVAVNGYDDVFVTGWFYDTVDFDPGTGIDEHTSNGQRDVFLSKFDKDGEW